MNIRQYIINRFNLNAEHTKIISNLSWALLGKMVNLVCGLVSSIFVARYLGPAQYGLLNYVVSYVFLFQVLALFGLDQIEIREEARESFSHRDIIGTAFIIKLVLAIICMTLCIGTSLWLESDRQTIILVAIYSFSILFTTCFVARNYFMAIVNNKPIVKSEISRSLICLCIKLVLIVLDADFIWFMAATLFDVFYLACGYLIGYQRHIEQVHFWSWNTDCAKMLLRESFPLLLTNAAVVLYQRIDQVMIGQMVDKESIGYFATASRFVEILIYIPTILNQTFSPILVKARKDSVAEYVKKGQVFMSASIWITLTASVITCLIAWPLVRYTFGCNYITAVPILQILCFKGFTCALSNSAGTMLIVEGVQKWAIFRDLIGCIVCISCNYFLLPHYGAIAAAVVALLSNIAAGYLANLLIPAYRHLFRQQTHALLLGWRDIIQLRQMFK